MQDLDELRFLAETALRSNAYDRAVQSYEEYLKDRPSDERALAGITEAYRALGNLERISDVFDRAVESEPGNLSLRADFVATIMARHLPNDALKLAEGEFAQHPEYIRFKIQIAQNHVALGNLDLARQLLWECHEVEPRNARILHYLTNLARAEDLERLGNVLDELWLSESEIDQDHLVPLGNARGKIAEKLKQFDKAWEGYELSAKVGRAEAGYQEQDFVQAIAGHKALFSKPDKPVSNDSDKQLGSEFVFVTSLPRSGSTLVEQILSSHHGVEGIGETSFCEYAFEIFHETPNTPSEPLINPTSITRAQDYYLEAAHKSAGGHQGLIVDKSISNFMYIGFLRTILPGAKFVHVTRNPLDSAFSCFATPFTSGYEWSNDQRDIGQMFRRYQKLMRHWMSLWPAHIKTIRYEDLVNDLEPTTRDLLEFCGLEWDPACLQFYKTKKDVFTASVTQVRQPIYKTAKGRAANFDQYLGPLKSAMGRAADPDWFLKP